MFPGRRHPGAPICLREVVAAWLEVQTCQASTRADYVHRSMVWLRFLDDFAKLKGQSGAVLGLDLLIPEVLQVYQLWLADTGQWPGGTRGASTIDKHLQHVLRVWRWAAVARGYRWSGLVPAAPERQIPRSPPAQTHPPSWAEQDACIQACRGWHRQLAILLRFTGIRAGLAMNLTWDAVSLREGTLLVEGRRLLLSPHLLTILRGWPRGRYVITKPAHCTDRRFRSRDLRRAWRRSGVRAEVWAPGGPNTHGRPERAFRDGFAEGLRELGASENEVDYLLGRVIRERPSLSTLRALVARIPAIGRTV